MLVAMQARQGKVKALLFDVFGTVVDWRGSLIAEGLEWNREVDWAQFADRWRAGYKPAMEKVRSGKMTWANLDSLHRLILDEVLKEFGIAGLSEEEKERWNRVWHSLKPWPDSVGGLKRLRTQYMIAPLSNGNVALLANMAKNAGLPWDLILSAELARHYKPDAEAYLTAVNLLGLKPEDAMMCAAHRSDLMAARECGLHTAFIYRPEEFGGMREADKAEPGEFDVVANDLVDLAAKLGA